MVGPELILPKKDVTITQLNQKPLKPALAPDCTSAIAKKGSKITLLIDIWAPGLIRTQKT